MTDERNAYPVRIAPGIPAMILEDTGAPLVLFCPSKSLERSNIF
jgi:hypothetical protein